MKSVKKYKLEWKPINAEAVNKILVDEHGFSEVRVDSALAKLKVKTKGQKGLGDFI